MNSQILYFQRTTPQMEQIFNFYMEEAVMLYNEEWTAQVTNEMHCALSPIWLSVYLGQRWLEMVRGN